MPLTGSDSGSVHTEGFAPWLLQCGNLGIWQYGVPVPGGRLDTDAQVMLPSVCVTRGIVITPGKLLIASDSFSGTHRWRNCNNRGHRCACIHMLV